MTRAFIDLHVHTSASFDSLARPADVVRAAISRGLTHLLVTDHDRIDGALAARSAAREAAERASDRAANAERPSDAERPGLTVLVGEEVRTSEGDLICAFLTEAIPPGMTAASTIEAVRAQGGMVGIPHPFDRFRGSLSRSAGLDALAPLVDWVETHNARLVGSGNERAAAFAREHGLPGVAVSDAHTVTEVGVAYTAMDGDPSTPAGLAAALRTAEIVPGRATFLVRLWTPAAKLVQRARGNVRVRPEVPA